MISIKKKTFNVAAENHMQNLDVVKDICDKMDVKFEDSIQFVENRWGQDLRYSVSSEKVRTLGWKPKFIGSLELGWVK